MYDRILVPTDGSPSAEAAARHGLVIAEAFDASLHVISVTGDTERSERLADAQAQDAISKLAELIEQESDLSCQSAIEHGRPHEAILSYSSENDIDLIVMGTHGRRGLSRVLLGSVTERVIRLSNDPVLAVPPHAIGREREGYDRILIPTDGSPGAAAAVEHGISIAERSGASVRVLYVIEGETGLPPIGDSLRDEAVEVLEAVTEEASDRDVSLTTHIQPGTPHEVINNFVSAHGIDLVTMGTHGRSGIRRHLLGSVTERVLRTSDAPVLTVRQDTE
ncbi:universal stress protein [Halobellus sp. Atlit-38R]|jgi:nucleotide-binding universal stress UspA family protein|uniref:universal stress protein n=1 Tax=Halobellus sp. Atlit-38R TaxID=2282131 RepID=UPI000EF26BB6|nr:universal stress protein [Halobellus sp. Atlit-38R]RLM89708.1 universal stress protein [Halobellus sp. Atlit-38R]